MPFDKLPLTIHRSLGDTRVGQRGVILGSEGVDPGYSRVEGSGRHRSGLHQLIGALPLGLGFHHLGFQG